MNVDEETRFAFVFVQDLPQEFGPTASCFRSAVAGGVFKGHGKQVELLRGPTEN